MRALQDWRAGRCGYRTLILTAPVLLWVLVSLSVVTAPASAAGSGWTVRPIGEPTNFSANQDAECQAKGQCDRYVVLLTNASARTAEPPITIEDTPPSVVTVKAFKGANLNGSGKGQNGAEGFTCTMAPLRCGYSESVPTGDTIAVIVEVEVPPSAPGSLTDTATVRGGGEGFAAVSASAQTP